MMPVLLAGLLCSACCRADAPSMRDVMFKHDDVALSGTLLAPADGGKHPALVLMPGSGVQTRDALLDIARFMSAHGLAVIVYDKQGTGSSAGSWTRESLDDLAGDARAAIAYLRAQPEVDAGAIGAWGISQSGWVVPRLARLYPLRFAICVTGGAVSPREIELHGYDMKLEHAGFGAGEREAARALVGRYLDYLERGDGRAELLAALHDPDARPWVAALGLDRVMPDEADRAKWSWVATYDPLPDIRSLRMPVLVLLGARDPFTPAEKALARWTDALAAAGNAHDQVNVYPAAGHGIRTNGHDTRTAPVYAPAYLDDQIAWLESIGVLRKPPVSAP